MINHSIVLITSSHADLNKTHGYVVCEYTQEKLIKRAVAKQLSQVPYVSATADEPELFKRYSSPAITRSAKAIVAVSTTVEKILSRQGFRFVNSDYLHQFCMHYIHIQKSDLLKWAYSTFSPRR